MKLFIDSTNLDEIKEASSWGIIDGVTTNPALIAKGGENMEATLRAVLDVSPGDVFCQVAGSEDLESLKGQAR
ncbi:MAG: fructose-6-phosphate aldolase, partial [Abditibacteriota bacterium]|nr:fructose-6-phosphate aldolase [Abditibacteriota bacterium]